MEQDRKAAQENQGDDDAQPAEIFSRTLPHSVEAERAVLGAIFVDNRAFERVSDFLETGHFALLQHGRIYEACSRLIERGQVADPLTLKSALEQDDLLADVGGFEYLATVAASAVSLINTGEYGRLIVDLSRRRDLIGLGEVVTSSAYGGTEDYPTMDIIQSAEEGLYALAEGETRDRPAQTARSFVGEYLTMAEEAFKNPHKLHGLSSGFPDLDRQLGGLAPTDFLVVAGRPSMGKSQFAVQIAEHVAGQFVRTSGAEGCPVGIFSLEMSGSQLMGRMASQKAHLEGPRIRRGELSLPEMEHLVNVIRNDVDPLPIYIDDDGTMTVSSLRSRARRMARRHGVGLIIIDYLQLLDSKRAGDNRVQQITEITRGLKAMAKDLHVPVLALSQLSRQVEQREDKRPMLSDLRESGSIEQDSDVVMFLYRPHYYLSRQQDAAAQRKPNEKDDAFAARVAMFTQRLQESEGIAEVHLAKQRHGPIGTTKLHWDDRLARFGNLTRRSTP